MKSGFDARTPALRDFDMVCLGGESLDCIKTSTEVEKC